MKKVIIFAVAIATLGLTSLHAGPGCGACKGGGAKDKGSESAGEKA